jgi:hypothetical protein
MNAARRFLLRRGVRRWRNDSRERVVSNDSGSSFEFESAHFYRWADDDVTRRVASKVRGNLVRATFDCKAYFCRPQYGHWNTGDFLPRKEPLQLREYVS